MPEGDTLFRTARALHKALAGQVITDFRTQFPALQRFHDDASVVGRTVEAAYAVGKWCVVAFSGDAFLLTHLLMSGSWHVYRVGEPWQKSTYAQRIFLQTSQYVAVAFNVPIAEFHTRRTLVRKPEFARVGPDLLNPAFDPEKVFQTMRLRYDEDIADVLLNQRILAGVGNVFKSEICFVCRVHPFAKVAALSDEQLKHIVQVSCQLLKENVVVSPNIPGGSRRTTHSLQPNVRLWVYGRAGKPCRVCGHPISLQKQGPYARVTFFCSHCQPLSKDGLVDCKGLPC